MTKPKTPLQHLPIKHQLFVLHYPQCGFNATQAAIAAGYSQKTAGVQGAQLLKKLSAHIDPLKQQLVQRTQVSGEEVVDRLGFIARSDIRQLMSWDTAAGMVRLKSSAEISDEMAYAISEIRTEHTECGTNIYVKLHDKTIALGLLGRYHNLFKRTPVSHGLVVLFQDVSAASRQSVASAADRPAFTKPSQPAMTIDFEDLPAASSKSLPARAR